VVAERARTVLGHHHFLSSPINGEVIFFIVHDRFDVIGTNHSDLVSSHLPELRFASRLNIVPVDGDVSVPVGARLFVEEASGVHQFVDDDVLTHAASGQRNWLLASSHSPVTVAPSFLLELNVVALVGPWNNLDAGLGRVVGNGLVDDGFFGIRESFACVICVLIGYRVIGPSPSQVSDSISFAGDIEKTSFLFFSQDDVPKEPVSVFP